MTCILVLQTQWLDDENERVMCHQLLYKPVNK